MLLQLRPELLGMPFTLLLLLLILAAMEYIYGVSKGEGNQITIQQLEENAYYDYVVTAKQLSVRNGNGFRELQFNDPWNKKPKDINLGKWTVESKISVPFSWSGSTAHPKIIDRTGSHRQIYADHYSKTIYQGLSYVADIKAVFDTIFKYSQYQNWSEYDVECAVLDRDKTILELQERMTELEIRLTEFQR